MTTTTEQQQRGVQRSPLLKARFLSVTASGFFLPRAVHRGRRTPAASSILRFALASASSSDAFLAMAACRAVRG